MMVDALGQSCRMIRWLVLMRFEASSRRFTVDLCGAVATAELFDLGTPETSISQALALSR